MIDLLGPEADRTLPICITVEPARDTIAVMADNVAAAHPRPVEPDPGSVQLMAESRHG